MIILSKAGSWANFLLKPEGRELTTTCPLIGVKEKHSHNKVYAFSFLNASSHISRAESFLKTKFKLGSYNYFDPCFSLA